MKIPYTIVVGKGTIKDLNKILKPALKKKLISEDEDLAIRHFRRRRQNREHSGKPFLLHTYKIYEYLLLFFTLFCVETARKKTNSINGDAEEQVEKEKIKLCANSTLLSKEVDETRNLVNEIKEMEKLRDAFSEVDTESESSNIDYDSLDELEQYSELRQKRVREILDGNYHDEEITRRKSKKLENNFNLSIRISPINFKKSLHKRFLEESKTQV